MSMHVTIDGTTVVVADAQTGERHLTHCRNTALAYQAAAAIKLRLDDPGPATFKEFVARWRTHHADVRFSERTKPCYYSVIDNWLVPHFGDMLLTEITPDVVRQFVRLLRTEGRRGRSITPVLMKLQAVMGVAVKWGYIDKNPVREIDAIFLDADPFVGA